MKSTAIAFILSLAAIPTAHAGAHDYYECTDTSGIAAYSVVPCAKGSRQRKIVDDTAPSTVDLSKAANAQSVSLMADGRGQFYTAGLINGLAMRFVVDTGATLVSLGAADARRLGIDFRRGRAATSNTANGQIPVWIVTLDSVSIGGVTLRHVGAAISQSDHPALLGMSFLKRMSVHVDGPVMTLQAR